VSGSRTALADADGGMRCTCRSWARSNISHCRNCLSTSLSSFWVRTHSTPRMLPLSLLFLVRYERPLLILLLMHSANRKQDSSTQGDDQEICHR
jgi:hypothetical protein